MVAVLFVGVATVNKRSNRGASLYCLVPFDFSALFPTCGSSNPRVVLRKSSTRPGANRFFQLCYDGNINDGTLPASPFNHVSLHAGSEITDAAPSCPARMCDSSHERRAAYRPGRSIASGFRSSARVRSSASWPNRLSASQAPPISGR